MLTMTFSALLWTVTSAKCSTPIVNFSITAHTITFLEGQFDSDACCASCSLVRDCAAFTVNTSGCALKASSSGLQPSAGVTSGVVVQPASCTMLANGTCSANCALDSGTDGVRMCRPECRLDDSSACGGNSELCCSVGSFPNGFCCTSARPCSYTQGGASCPPAGAQFCDGPGIVACAPGEQCCYNTSPHTCSEHC